MSLDEELENEMFEDEMNAEVDPEGELISSLDDLRKEIKNNK